jgi:hypothetical protein
VRLQSERGVYDEISRLSPTWNLSITDVSGKRSQRTLWASVMDSNYTAVLFVASLASFDQYSYVSSNRRVNKLIESMELLKWLVQVSYFESTNVILILNQKDVFDKKLSERRISFAKNFPLHLTERFYYDNQQKKFPRDGLYEFVHSEEEKKEMQKHDDQQLQREAQKEMEKQKKSYYHIKFDATKEFDQNYCIEYIKGEFSRILPPKLRKTLRIYITCAIATDTFGFVLTTLTQQIIHIEQMRRVKQEEEEKSD